MPEAQPVTFIGVHERTPEMRILYVSSSTRQALLYEPEEFIGLSPQDFIATERDGEEYKKHHGSQSDDNIMMNYLVAKNKIGQPVYIRSIIFACGNANVSIATCYLATHMDLSSQQLIVRRYKCILGENDDGSSEASADAGGDRRYLLRSTYQACFILGNANPLDGDGDGDGDTGPRIIFSTNSVSRILDVDSCDLQDVPFLSLVDVEDNRKACEFLEKVMTGDELILECLHLLVSPLEESQLRNPRTVSVQFMAMGSDDGAIMLCQLERSSLSGRGEHAGYMSLEELISSEPETSDISTEWGGVCLP